MPDSLLRRTLTAAVLVPCVVAAVLGLSSNHLSILLAVVVQLAAWEWAGLAGVRSSAGRSAYAIAVSCLLAALWFAHANSWALVILVGACIWWCILAVWLVRLSVIRPAEGIDHRLFLIGSIVLGAPWLAIVHLHAMVANGPSLVLLLLVLIWIADSIAYFAGRFWGLTKLAPVLSPGKTWVGFYGALTAAAICGIGFAMVSRLALGEAIAVSLVAVLTVTLSVIGDLFESMLKRRRGVKDSGRLLPGHGGVLDRIDSLTAAAPVFTLGVLLTGTYT